MGRPCVCPICQKTIPNSDESVFYKKKHYHPDCYQLQLDKDELCEYICRVFSFKAPGPRVYGQITRFINQGFTYKGIHLALKYFYEVKHGDIKKANEGIGIVPYVYNDAMQYYSQVAQQQEELAKEIGQAVVTTKVTTIVKKKKEKKPKISYNLEEIL